ncbi:MAG TPA: hypothetical protein VM120_16975 [Bryobacteraceae bacterium]|nr:hypothetical protein [Bryobacteraceae bacterium]
MAVRTRVIRRLLQNLLDVPNEVIFRNWGIPRKTDPASLQKAPDPNPEVIGRRASGGAG